MKRIGNIYKDIISIENLMLADERAQKGKSGQYGVMLHNLKREENIQKLHLMLATKTYMTSDYDIFKVHEPKERTVYRLP
jgi:nucleoside-triphosphatase THEP1